MFCPRTYNKLTNFDASEINSCFLNFCRVFTKKFTTVRNKVITIIIIIIIIIVINNNMLIEYIIYLSSTFVLTVFLKVQLNFGINVI